jgi:dTDP-4-amino-4,6-dideoxygalactose transaminase
MIYSYKKLSLIMNSKLLLMLSERIPLIKKYFLPKFLERRQALARRYFEALAVLPLVLPADDVSGGSHSWHLFVIRLEDDAKMSRDELIELLSDKGIGTSVHYVPLHRQPYWRDKYSLTNDIFVEADKAYLSMISIPLYTSMTNDQQEYIIQVLQGALG